MKSHTLPLHSQILGLFQLLGRASRNQTRTPCSALSRSQVQSRLRSVLGFGCLEKQTSAEEGSQRPRPLPLAFLISPWIRRKRTMCEPNLGITISQPFWCSGRWKNRVAGTNHYPAESVALLCVREILYVRYTWLHASGAWTSSNAPGANSTSPAHYSLLLPNVRPHPLLGTWESRGSTRHVSICSLRSQRSFILFLRGLPCELPCQSHANRYSFISSTHRERMTTSQDPTCPGLDARLS